LSKIMWSHEALLLPHPVSAVRVREFVCHRLTAHDLAYLIDDVRLVASELATSAALRGRRPFTVSLRGTDELVVLRVHDSSRLKLAGAAAGMDPAGRDLAIVEAISHDWGVDRRAGTVRSVWASFEVGRFGGARRTRPARPSAKALPARP
jgi:hypothetical protein